MLCSYHSDKESSGGYDSAGQVETCNITRVTERSWQPKPMFLSPGRNETEPDELILSSAINKQKKIARPWYSRKKKARPLILRFIRNARELGP
jgi:hypothetical protein